MYKLTFYVPVTHVDAVKSALFSAGGGRIGRYDCCCWQVLGQGQFRPLTGSSPFSGSQGQVEKVDEYRVEMICADGVIECAVAALKSAHPYEEPAYDVLRVEEF